MNCKYCKADCVHRGEHREKECKGYIPKTNADRIRAMSDEELADWLARVQIDNVVSALKIAGIHWEERPDLKDEVKKDALEWLRQPAGTREE